MVHLVLVRHGQSVWNKLNEFTGWVDVPLTGAGETEARTAADKIKAIPFDVAFTSQLMRAHQTLCLLFQDRDDRVLVFKHALGQQHAWEHYRTAKPWEIPVYKSKALNERYYGELQGLNKAETAQQYGAEQVRQWRRSYSVRPPGGESLEDVAKRVVPYYEGHVKPFLLQGKHVIIVAHGNSLRALVMHLEGLTPEQVIELELPTGEPVLYDVDAQGSAHRTR